MSELREIHMTRLDYDRLWRVVDRAGEKAAIDALEGELDRAVLVRSEEVPPDVVTMNSRVELEDVDTGERKRITLVFPERANVRLGRISVLAPMGMAILGCQERQILEWEMPGGLRRLRVRRILFQPEAAGRFDL
jgi:regulator of nucleoside diphosphate kinase